jgi:hypothetical protein
MISRDEGAAGVPWRVAGPGEGRGGRVRHIDHLKTRKSIGHEGVVPGHEYTAGAAGRVAGPDEGGGSGARDIEDLESGGPSGHEGAVSIHDDVIRISIT